MFKIKKNGGKFLVAFMVSLVRYYKFLISEGGDPGKAGVKKALLKNKQSDKVITEEELNIEKLKSVAAAANIRATLAKYMKWAQEMLVGFRVIQKKNFLDL